MKKLFITIVLALPVLVFATPANNAETATLALVQDLDTVEDYQWHQKGRSGDSGIRSMDYVPAMYDNSSLENKTFKENIINEVKKPGIVFGYNCFHWKNCLKNSYKETHGYEQSYKKFSPARGYGWKAKTRGNMRGRKNQLDGERSGLYKVERWGR